MKTKYIVQHNYDPRRDVNAHTKTPEFSSHQISTLHPLKQPSPISSTLAGISISTRLHLLNSQLPIRLRRLPLPNVTRHRDEQLLKHCSPISSTLAGISISCRSLNPLNASLPKRLRTFPLPNVRRDHGSRFKN